MASGLQVEPQCSQARPSTVTVLRLLMTAVHSIPTCLQCVSRGALCWSRCADSGDIVDYLEDKFTELPLGKQNSPPHV